MNKKGEGSPEWLPFFCDQGERDNKRRRAIAAVVIF
jgi:hypothetical protein